VWQQNRLATALVESPGCWIDLVNPDLEDLEALAARHTIPLEFLTAALDPDERARFETEDDASLVLLRIPVLNQTENSDIPYLTRPLAIVLKGDLLITVCLLENPIIDDFTDGRVRNFNPENRLLFVLQVFFRASIRYLRYLRDINTRTTNLERELQRSQKNSDLIRLLNFEKSLVFFTTSLRSNQLMMERFHRTRFFKDAATEDDRELLEDIVIDNQQAIEMANIYTNILTGLMDTFATVISNNLNQVMKTLTKITIILMLPTLLASLYGMNVELPFQAEAGAFTVIALTCLALIMGGWVALSNKRLF
jgi:magnesium transporter